LGLINELCKWIIWPKYGYTNTAAKQGNAEEQPEAGCEIIRLNRILSRGKRKNIKFLWSVAKAAGHFLCNHGQLVLSHGCQNAWIALHSASIVIVDIGVDHPDEGLFVGKAPAVIPLPLQDAPEAL